jgi:hypothetical protein
MKCGYAYKTYLQKGSINRWMCNECGGVGSTVETVIHKITCSKKVNSK